MPKKNNDNIITINNVGNFSKIFCASKVTQENASSFLQELIRFDPLHRTEFELSFKVRDAILNQGEIRLLNLDINTYSNSSEKLFLMRLKAFERIMEKRCKNPLKEKIISAIRSISETPLDIYIGADIKEHSFLFAFWLILGGVKKDGSVNFTTGANDIVAKIFSTLDIDRAFSVDEKDILNIGFDIDEKEIYYKIYYFLNARTEKLIEKSALGKTKIISSFLGDRYKHWFFVSERFFIDKSIKKLQRKKFYLEFLDVVHTRNNETYEILEGIFRIIGCPFAISDLKKYLEVLDARIVIIAFENDGTVTFYIRV